MGFYLPSCRLSALPVQLNVLLHVRLISSSSSSSNSSSSSSSSSGRHSGHGPNKQHTYPYPTHPRPTPHQIFHLPPGASPQAIKTRYYDLVRAHHPDSTHCRALPPAERHARFQAITAAYDVLRGKTPASAFGPQRDYYREEVLRRKHMYQTYHNPHAEYTRSKAEWTAGPDERWKDRVVLIVGILTLAAGLAPGLFILPYVAQERHRSAVSNLNQARSDARQYGELRRDELRRVARDIRDGREVGGRDGAGVADELGLVKDGGVGRRDSGKGAH
ncbi:hypothetical protein BDZ94DRAFT_1227660 [Collybia nuda]|uniref:J domain-containing protein n=1 Tax=Collybia nuda TaxID=64659 RepID=A0A9P5XTU2_9AGAR|nr:hypothetical protein BDZ94DRAFT_1227660 [Collybia nuda]